MVNDTPRATGAEVVVVGGTDRFDYPLLRDAALAARHCGDLLGTGRDPTLPMPEGPWPGTGALLAAVEVASGADGGDRGQARGAADAGRAGPAGRWPHAGGRRPAGLRRRRRRRGGLDAALVLSGSGTGEAAEDGPQPVATADTLAELVGVSAS